MSSSLHLADIVTDIHTAAERMRPIHPLPGQISDSVLESAEAAVDGLIIVHYQGEHRLPLGRRQIDWLNPSFPRSQAGLFVYRMGFIGDLATAYAVTKDERYAEAARDYLSEYIAYWPTDAVGQNNDIDNTLSLCGRNATWSRSLHLLAASEAFDAAFLASVVTFNAAQFDWLRHHMSTTINWRISNARNLLTGSLYLAFLDQAADWRQHAVRVLNDAWFRQFLPDGVHCERNPIYHTGMASTFRDLYRLGCQLPELGLVMSLEGLIPVFDFALACVKPNGYLCGIHDSQSEFTGHRRDGVHTTSHKGVDNTTMWEEFRREFELPLEYPPTRQVFPDAGLAFLRTGWDEDAAWMSFDGTQWGGGHCHLSRNAIQLHAHRQSMIVDPGWLSYESNEWGLYGRSTRAHSTCNLNGLNQSATNPSRLQSFGAPGYDAVFSVYEGGYWDTNLAWTFTHAGDGLWAQHARLLFWVQDRFAFVADSMFRLPQQPGDPEDRRPSFECVWQLTPGAEVDLQPERDRAIARWKAAGLLLLTPIRPEDSQYEIHAGETGPLRGWTPGEGSHHPAPQLVLNTPRMQRQHDYYVSILTPFRGTEAPEVAVEAKSPMGQTGYVRLRWADGTEDAVYWGCNFGMMLGTQPEFETDSSLVHLRKDAAGRVMGGCCVNGTYLEPFSPALRPKPETFTF
ncbi:MAG: heparinase II/III family protein [Armatimonadota bacterium]